jgi:hypothetical protein
MKTVLRLHAFTLLVVSGLATAAEPKKSESVPVSEPVKCYQIVWGSKDQPGLALTAGQAIELCGGAADALRVVRCFAQSWAHTDDGGLGLTAGQAIRLCKANSVQSGS